VCLSLPHGGHLRKSNIPTFPCVVCFSSISNLNNSTDKHSQWSHSLKSKFIHLTYLILFPTTKLQYFSGFFTWLILGHKFAHFTLLSKLISLQLEWYKL
jgi:hypothetical protein